MAWFKAKAAAKGCAEIWINKAIGSDWAPDWWNDMAGETSAREFIDAVEALGELTDITVHLNSPGGDVASGITIMNYLKNHSAKIHIRVEGMAASIASVILMAGDTRTIAVGATVMVHNPAGWLGGYYTEHEMRDNADTMAKVKLQCVEAYVMGTGKNAAEISELLDKGDTYLTADESIEWGFATDKDDTLKAVASIDADQFKQQFKLASELKEKEADIVAKANLIEELQAELVVLKPPQTVEANAIIEACNKAGFESLALKMISGQFSQTLIDQRLKMAADISDICAASEIDATPILSKIDDTNAVMKALVLSAKVAADQDLDNQQPPALGNSKQPNSAAAYNQLNNRGG